MKKIFNIVMFVVLGTIMVPDVLGDNKFLTEIIKEQTKASDENVIWKADCSEEEITRINTLLLNLNGQIKIIDEYTYGLYYYKDACIIYQDELIFVLEELNLLENNYETLEEAWTDVFTPGLSLVLFWECVEKADILFTYIRGDLEPKVIELHEENVVRNNEDHMELKELRKSFNEALIQIEEWGIDKSEIDLIALIESNLENFEITIAAEWEKSQTITGIYERQITEQDIAAISSMINEMLEMAKEMAGVELIKDNFGNWNAIIYSVNGKKLNDPIKGVNILLFPDGSSKKIIISK